jgi:hypothetical protein
VRNSGEFAEYVSELEDDESPEAAEGSAAARIDPALTHELVDEIEDFLRDQG